SAFANLIKAGTYTLITGSSVTGTFSSVTDLGVYDNGPGGGVGYTATSVTLTLTHDLLAGDANLDGTVNFLDVSALTGGLAGAGTGWANGNFNGDSVVNFLDVSILTANLGHSISTAVSRAVPEPSVAALAFMGAVGYVRIRRKIGV